MAAKVANAEEEFEDSCVRRLGGSECVSMQEADLKSLLASHDSLLKSVKTIFPRI